MRSVSNGSYSDCILYDYDLTELGGVCCGGLCWPVYAGISCLFFNGGFIIRNDYVRMYIVEHYHTFSISTKNRETPRKLLIEIRG